MSKDPVHRINATIIVILFVVIAACSGHSSPGSYSIGGTISGLASGSSLTLTDNGSDVLVVSVNGAFSFATPLSGGVSYAVSLTTAPARQTCTLSGGSGTVGNTPVNSIRVTWRRRPLQ
jgi:hypothetical protein